MRLERGVLLFRELGRTDEALADFNALVEEDPIYAAPALFNRAMLAQQNGRYQDALHDLEAYMALSPATTCKKPNTSWMSCVRSSSRTTTRIEPDDLNGDFRGNGRYPNPISPPTAANQQTANPGHLLHKFFQRWAGLPQRQQRRANRVCAGGPGWSA